MKAIILAGGFGTRLRAVVKDVPKPLAPVQGVPFLDYILLNLESSGISEVVLSVCYLKEKIINRYGEKYGRMSIKYSAEDTPLLTGGAIKKALSMTDGQDVLILNGDTYLELNINKFVLEHKRNNADITVAAFQMKNFDRYGALEIDSQGRILNFSEKKYCVSGIINAGVYCVKSNIFEDELRETFSFEEFMAQNIRDKVIRAFLETSNFLDIGIPEDYARAESIIAKQ